MPEARSLNVFWNDVHIAQLVEQGAIWSLQYVPEWLADARRFAISPALPLQADVHLDGASQRPVQWFFDNLLPEEGARSLIAADAELSAEDAFGLLAHYGAESAGSLTLLPAGEMPPTDGGLSPLDDATLSRWIHALPRVSLASRTEKRMSLAGAQHKMAVNLLGDVLFQPTATLPSTHILKPEHSRPDDFPHTVINEWFVMTLAALSGLNVPRVTLRFVPEPVYLIDRFDRTRTDAACRRLHALDGCQLLGLDRIAKYRQCTPAQLNAIANLCLTPIPVRMQIYQWLLFNLLLANDDAHLKNLSVLAEGDQYQLAPFYDLLSTAIYAAEGQHWFDRTLSTPWAEIRTYADIHSREDVHALGAMLGLPSAVVIRTTDAFLTRFEHAVPSAWQAMLGRLAQADVPAHYPAGAKRQVRSILYLPVREMLAKFGITLDLNAIRT